MSRELEQKKLKLASPTQIDYEQTDAVNHPKHYQHPSGIECIEIVRHENFNIGNAIKYLWRRKEKGDEIENLKKARWYIDDEIERLEKEMERK